MIGFLTALVLLCAPARAALREKVGVTIQPAVLGGVKALILQPPDYPYPAAIDDAIAVCAMPLPPLRPILQSRPR